MGYEIRVEQFPGCRLAVVRRRAAVSQLSRVVPEACGTVWSALRSQNIRGGRHVAVYMDEVNLEVGVELNVAFSGVGEVAPSSLPSGEVVTTTHFGPYQQLAGAYNAIKQWLTANRRETVQPCWEIYGHWEDKWNSDPSLIRTDVYLLLKTAG